MHPRNNRFRRPHGLRSVVGIRKGESRPGLRVTAHLLAALAIAALAVGCFSRDPMRIKGSGLPGDDSASAEAGGATHNASAPGATSDVPGEKPSAATLADDAAFDRIWQQRSAELSSTKDYPIGPGDVLTASVPQMEELQDRKVRVTPLGTVELPLVGSVRAGGLTEEQLEAELDQKLNNFMYNPQASVYVNEYHNREVAVIGSVNHPGLVLLNSPSETILDVLTQAGGLASTAADEIVLIPVEQGDPTQAKRLAQVAYNSGGTVGGTTATDVATPEGDPSLASETSNPVGQAGEIMPHQPG